MKRFRLALVLAAVLAILSGIAYWDEWKTKQEESSEKDKDRLLSFSPDAVSEILYTDKGEDRKKNETFRLRKKDGVWRIVEPVSAKADSGQIENLLKTVSEYKTTKVVGKDKDSWPQFGVDNPVRSIELTIGDKGEKKTVFVGNKTPVGYESYSRTSDGDEVYVGSQLLMTASAKTMTDLRDKSFLSIDEEKIKTITLKKKGDAPIRITKEKDQYTIVAPTAVKADQEAISGFLTELETEKVSEFVDRPPKTLIEKFSPGKRFAELVWENSDGNTETLFFAQHDGAMYASYDPDSVIFKLSESAPGKLNKRLLDFRDARILDFQPSELEAVEVNDRAYKRVDGDWYLAADADKKKGGKNQSIQNLLVDLQYAKAKNVLSPLKVLKTISLAPLHRIKIATSKGKGKETKESTIDIWSQPGNTEQYIVKISGKDDVLLVDKAVFAALETPKENPVKEEKPDYGFGD